MNKLVTVLVGLASVVVIAAGALWLWQAYEAGQANAQRQIAAGEAVMFRSQCDGYAKTLRQADADPTSVSEAEKQAAAEGWIKCRSL